MRAGLVMECDYRYGATQVEAFDEAFVQAEMAEELGLHSVWMAERHFAAPSSQLDSGGTGIPSVAAAPLTWASAIAARTSRLHIGTGVSVLPLCHPIRLAEETATIDHISKGRLELGVGRSSFPGPMRAMAFRMKRAGAVFRKSSISCCRLGRKIGCHMPVSITPLTRSACCPSPTNNPTHPFALPPPLAIPFRKSAAPGFRSSPVCVALISPRPPCTYSRIATPGRKPVIRAQAMCSCAFRCMWLRRQSGL